MEIRQLKQKNVRTLLKRGFTLADFVEKYGCSEEDIVKRIEQLYRDRRQINDIFSEMEKNKKQPSGQGQSRKQKDIDINPVALAEANRILSEEPRIMTTESRLETIISKMEVETEATTKAGAEAMVETEVETEAETELPLVEQLEQLKELEAQQSDDVIELEIKYEALRQKRHARKKELLAQDDELARLEKAIETVHERVNQLATECDDLGAQMNDVTDRRRILNEQLAETRQRIQKLATVGVGVYADGTIAPLDGHSIILDDTGHESVFDEILKHPACTDLRVREIRTLARMLQITMNSTVEVEMICDVPELETAFATILNRGEKVESAGADIEVPAVS